MLTFARIIIGLTAAIWLGYGAWLTVNPKGLEYMGYDLSHWSATVEVMAMYGCFEFMLGVFALLGLLNTRQYMRPNLVLWAFLYWAMVVGRLAGIAIWGGSYSMTFGAAGLPDGYNPGTVYFYELPMAIFFTYTFFKMKDSPLFAR